MQALICLPGLALLPGVFWVLWQLTVIGVH